MIAKLGAGANIPCGRDPESAAEVLRLKILPGVEIKVVCALQTNSRSFTHA